MKRLLMILPVFLLAGCLSTAPVKRNFPEIPEELKTSCPDLKTIDPATTKFSTVISTVTDNYTSYHECKVKVDAWLEWYKTQKVIFDSVK